MFFGFCNHIVLRYILYSRRLSRWISRWIAATQQSHGTWDHSMQSKPPQFNSKFIDHEEHAIDATVGSAAGNSGSPLAPGTPGGTREQPATPVYGRFTKKRSKPVVDKREIQMRRSSYGSLQWNLVSPGLCNPARSRRWNVVLIAILAFIVLGAFVAAKAPRAGGVASDTSKVSLQKSENAAAPAHHARSNDGTQSVMHNRGASSSLRKGVGNVHHAG